MWRLFRTAWPSASLRRLWSSPRRLSRVGRYTWRLHWRASVASGLAEGILGLATFVAMRSLGAPIWIAPAMVVLSQASWIASPMWEHAVSRVPPHRAFRIFGLLAFAGLAAIAFVGVERTAGHDGYGTGDLTLFLGCFVLVHVVFGGQIAQRGALIRANYAVLNRGRVFGALSVVSRSASIASTKAAGALLNADPRWLRVVFPLAGLLYLAENATLSLVRWRRGGRTHGGGAGFREAWKRSARLLRDDPTFRRYELAWMLYGIGFLMGIPMVTVLGESVLQFSYNEWTWAQGAALPVATVVGTIPAGRLVDRVGAVRTTAFAYALLTAFFALLPFATTFGHVVAAFVLWGFAMAGIGIVWNLGPLAFAAEGEGRKYAAAHVALVGVRSVIGPPLGLLIAETVALRATFVVSACLIATAGVICWRLPAPSR